MWCSPRDHKESDTTEQLDSPNFYLPIPSHPTISKHFTSKQALISALSCEEGKLHHSTLQMRKTRSRDEDVPSTNKCWMGQAVQSWLSASRLSHPSGRAHTISPNDPQVFYCISETVSFGCADRSTKGIDSCKGAGFSSAVDMKGNI